MLSTLLNEKTTVLLCIIGAICITILAAMGKVEGSDALTKILYALGIGAGRQVVSGMQRGIRVNGTEDPPKGT